MNHEKRGLGILGDQEHVAHGVNRRRVNDNAVEVTKQLIENAAELYIIEELGRIRRVQGKLDVSDRAAAVLAAEDLGVLRIPRPRRPAR